VLSDLYRRQAALLVRLLPLVAEESCFALKGGTAINFFVRDMPRLSVDIDLMYLPVDDRASSLAKIESALKRIGERAAKAIPGARLQEVRIRGEGTLTRIDVRTRREQVKVEVSPVLRGSVFDAETRSVSPRVEREFGFAEMQVVSFADLYAGKIVAALDRQHPRDLFDVRVLLATEGVDHRLREAFVAYLVSHDRPMIELLVPNHRDIRGEFERGFSGMTDEAVGLDDLLATRELLVRTMMEEMPEKHRRFLVSLEAGEPDWSLLAIPAISNLPAVRWRLRNLSRLAVSQRRTLREALANALNVT
jgi:predicted nucleotidyltransferase component of viral defense system